MRKVTVSYRKLFSRDRAEGIEKVNLGVMGKPSSGIVFRSETERSIYSCNNIGESVKKKKNLFTE
jgi:hypothetical protein